MDAVRRTRGLWRSSGGLGALNCSRGNQLLVGIARVSHSRNDDANFPR